MRLKMLGSHFLCQVVNKFLNDRQCAEMVEREKIGTLPSPVSCESSVSNLLCMMVLHDSECEWLLLKLRDLNNLYFKINVDDKTLCHLLLPFSIEIREMQYTVAFANV